MLLFVEVKPPEQRTVDMPNGGPDNCMTCRYNRNRDVEQPADAECEIRGIALSGAPWTYCANHHAHNPDGVEFPVGPVFRANIRHRRLCRTPSPDSDTIREGLLDLLNRVGPVPRDAYFTATQFDTEVIRQLRDFGEKRAVPGLRRAMRLPLDAAGLEGGKLESRIQTMAAAVEALALIAGEEALADLKSVLEHRPERENRLQMYDKKLDPLWPVRLAAVRGLEHCAPAEALPALETACEDENREVAAAADDLFDAWARKGALPIR